MKIISLEDFTQQIDLFVNEAKAGKMFVYPTDTIYGIGGIYTKENVEKTFAIKQRDKKKMFSIIAPNFERIVKNYELTKFPSLIPHPKEKLQKYLEQYHGVTYIFDYAKPGVRIIKHPIQNFVQKLGIPFITTSCNKAGEKVVLETKDIPEGIKNKIDYIIDGGVLGGKPSVLIDFIADKIIER